MTVKGFYLTTQGINACRIHFGANPVAVTLTAPEGAHYS